MVRVSLQCSTKSQGEGERTSSRDEGDEVEGGTSAIEELRVGLGMCLRAQKDVVVVWRLLVK